MLGALEGPWLPSAALALLAVAVWRGPRPGRGEVWQVVAIATCAAVARIVWGLWGPLHVNGQGPLWIRGALEAGALAGYGPGYYELFAWLTRLGAAPDRAIFAANAFLSALSPALLYAVARLAGVERGGALAAAVVLAVDAVTIHTAASELYIWPLIALVLAVQVALGIFVQARQRRDRLAGALALTAASLLGAATARIQPVGYLTLALSPLVVLCAGRPQRWRERIVLAAEAATAIGAAVLLTTGRTIVHALGDSPVSAHGIVSVLRAQGADVWILVLLIAVWVARRWARPPWLPIIAASSLVSMWMVESSFQRHPYQQLFYARLCWPGVLLGAAALLPRRLQGSGWALSVGVVVAAALQVPAWPYLGARTTEQREYAFLQEVLPSMPATCTLASVSRAGKRVWEIPAYLMASGAARAIEDGSQLRDAIEAADCVVYVRSSLCSSVEGRPLCDSAEHGAPLERVASRVFEAAPSDVDLPYDRSEVEVVVSLASGGMAVERGPATVRDGAPITPEFAKVLYERLAPLRESDGCRVVRFDTTRFRINIGLQARSGAAHGLEIAATRERGDGLRGVGDWMVAAPPELARDCAATLAAIERALLATSSPPPPPPGADGSDAVPLNQVLIILSFALLVLGTLHILYREVRVHRPSPYAVVALVGVWGAALWLRLVLSPRTFLHEYYHIAETVSAYLTGSIAPAYGQTGPVLFRTVAALLGRPDDEQVIFLTNAVLASLAVPAAALLDLALLRSWPRAVCAGVLLCALPLHLRFSAAEDLFVLAVTFGMWAAALFALYLRTRRVEDALCAALALSLGMQTRPEMVFFPAVLVALVLVAERRAWRALFAWPTLVALVMLGTLLIPRLLELQQVLYDSPVPAASLPELRRYLGNLVLFQPQVTPPLYWMLLVLGLAWGAWRAPWLTAWVALVFLGYTLLSISMFDNPPYRLRSQLLPTSFVVLIAAGIAPLWMAFWKERRRLALALGACVLSATAALIVLQSRDFVTELRDQQLEWAFLERTVPRLPERATLLAAVEVGGRNLDAFPDFLLRRANKNYRMVDVRRAATGDAAWPTGSDLLYYQGMYCYFAFDDEASPDPMTAPCRKVQERYVAEPVLVEDLHTRGYSWLRYARDGRGPYRIGFFRLKPRE
jgi:hypothetical protein